MSPCDSFQHAGKLPAMTRLFLMPGLFFFTAVALAEEDKVIPLYQVEVIVFQHLNSDATAEAVSQVSDYRMVTRPLPLPRESQTDLQSIPQAAARGSVMQDPVIHALDDRTAWPPSVFDSADFEPGPQTEPGEDLIYEISGPSEAMRQAWDRLQNSPAYEPLHYAGWQQHAYAPEEQEPVRFHGDIALAGPGEEQPAEAGKHTAAENRPERPSPVPVIDLTTAMPDMEKTGAGAPAADAAPDAEEAEEIDEAQFTSYRLDGQFTLVRRKFLHLVIDLEWRDPAAVPAIFEDDADGNAPAYLLYSVLQRRQVREDRLEYFDTPLLGVLARVSEVELPAEPGQAGDSAVQENLPDPDIRPTSNNR